MVERCTRKAGKGLGMNMTSGGWGVALSTLDRVAKRQYKTFTYTRLVVLFVYTQWSDI